MTHTDTQQSQPNVVFIMSDDQGPWTDIYALGGVLLEMHSDGIIAVATDGRRLAKQDTDCFHSLEAGRQGDHRAIDILLRAVRAAVDAPRRAADRPISVARPIASSIVAGKAISSMGRSASGWR